MLPLALSGRKIKEKSLYFSVYHEVCSVDASNSCAFKNHGTFFFILWNPWTTRWMSVFDSVKNGKNNW